MTETNVHFDEMLLGADLPRQPYESYFQWFRNEDVKALRRKSAEAESFFRRIGITFNVYGQEEADERLIPFDIVPRIISATEWRTLERGIDQRVRAINAFLHDIYHRADFMQARALNLVQSQPGLSRFLNGRSGGNFDVAATSTKGDLSFASGAGSPVWFALDASLTDLSDSAEARYVLATIGGHMSLSDGLLLGGMLQFDDAELDMPGVVGDTSGQGWLAGPYVVARLGDQPLYFEGRLLWGESDNKVNPLGTFTDSFETERFLGLAALEGRYEADEVTMFPRFELSRVEDRQKAYVDGLSNTVPQQTIRQTDVSLGLDFEMPLTGAQDTQFVTWGLSGIWSNVEGSGAASAFIDESDTARGRVDLGYVYRNDAGFEASADAFIDGLGADAFTTYGVALNLRLKF